MLEDFYNNLVEQQRRPYYEGSCEERNHQMAGYMDHIPDIRQFMGEASIMCSKKMRNSIMCSKERRNNELIPTRTVTGWRVCMDYRKLNKATRNDHFPLPFIDQILDRLAEK